MTAPISAAAHRAANTVPTGTSSPVTSKTTATMGSNHDHSGMLIREPFWSPRRDAPRGRTMVRGSAQARPLSASGPDRLATSVISVTFWLPPGPGAAPLQWPQGEPLHLLEKVKSMTIESPGQGAAAPEDESLDRRRGPDRRKQWIRALWYGNFNPRRRGSRRNGERRIEQRRLARPAMARRGDADRAVLVCRCVSDADADRPWRLRGESFHGAAGGRLGAGFRSR